MRAVLLDLDDTLIEEEPFARAQLRRTAELLPGVDADTWDNVVIESARALWRTSTYYPEFLDLGFASWEGLWATFEGVHPRLEGLAAWAAPYRRAAWRSALDAVGHTAVDGRVEPFVDGLVERLVEHYIEGQRSGHPVLPGAVELVAGLARAVPVALVTNGPPDIQRLKIDQAGIGAHLSAVVDLG